MKKGQQYSLQTSDPAVTPRPSTVIGGLLLGRERGAIHGVVAQLVEHSPEEGGVVCSNQTDATIRKQSVFGCIPAFQAGG